MRLNPDTSEYARAPGSDDYGLASQNRLVLPGAKEPSTT